MVKKLLQAVAMALVSLGLYGCGSVDKRSIQERSAEFTAESLTHTGCSNGVVEGSEKLGTSTDSRVEYYSSSRQGTEVVIRYQQRGFMDVKCKPPVKKESATTPAKPTATNGGTTPSKVSKTTPTKNAGAMK